MHIGLRVQVIGPTSRHLIGIVVRVDQWQIWDQTDTHTRFICCSHFAPTYLEGLSYFTFCSLSNLHLFKVNQRFPFPKMASNHHASSEDISDTKRKHKRLTVAEKMRVLDMTKEGKSHAAIACHFGLCINTFNRIKKAGSRIRKTADITPNMSTKRAISLHHETFIYMEAALVKWIVNCRKKNVALDMKAIRMKAWTSTRLSLVNQQLSIWAEIKAT